MFAFCIHQNLFFFDLGTVVIESAGKMQVPSFSMSSMRKDYFMLYPKSLVENTETESDESKEGPPSILITLDKNFEEATPRGRV